MQRTFFVISFAFVSLWWTSSLSAQSNWTKRGEHTTIEIEYLRPILKDGSNPSSVNIVTMSSRIRLGQTTFFILELPWVAGAASLDFSNVSTSESSIGSLYYGFEFHPRDIPFILEAGGRYTVFSHQAITPALAGITGDFGRLEAYAPNITQFRGSLGLEPDLGSGFTIRFKLGPSFDISTDGTQGAQTLIDYAGILSYESEVVGAGVGFIGRVFTSGSPSDPSVDQLESMVRIHIDHVHPALQLRTPLDDALQRAFDLEVGLNLAYEF